MKECWREYDRKGQTDPSSEIEAERDRTQDESIQQGIAEFEKELLANLDSFPDLNPRIPMPIISY